MRNRLPRRTSTSVKVRAAERTAGRLQPYGWLGAGAVTLGVGAALAGAGSAHADGGYSANSSTETKAAASEGAPTTAGHARAQKATGTATSSAANAISPTSGPSQRAARASAVIRRPQRNSVEPVQVSYPKPAPNTANLGPVLGALVGVLKEIRYVAANEKPFLNPVQLPSSPSQSTAVGTFNAYNPNGNPFTVTVTGQPANGTVSIDPQSGHFLYTPGDALAATGGSDSITLTATDTGNHPLADFLGQAPHSVTATVPVTVAAAQPSDPSGVSQLYITNTDYQPMQVAAYQTNGASLFPALGTELTTGQSGLFKVPNDNTVTVLFNPVGVAHEGVLQVIGINPPSSPPVVSPDGTVVYTTSGGAGGKPGAVQAIDADSGFVTSTILVSGSPDSIAVSPDGSRLYVTNSALNTVAVVNTAYAAVTQGIDVGSTSRSIVMSPDGKSVYVSVKAGVAVIDTATNQVTTTIGTGSITTNVLAISPDGRTLYNVGGDASTSNSTDGGVAIIDIATNTLAGTISLGSGAPFSLAVSPDGTSLYVAEAFSNKVGSTYAGDIAVLDTAAGTVTRIGGFGQYNPQSLAITPDGKRLYADSSVFFSTAPEVIWVVDTTTNTLLTNDTTGFPDIEGSSPLSSGLVVSPDGTRLYAATVAGDAKLGNLVEFGIAPSGTTGDGGVAQYTVTLTGGSTASTCSAKNYSGCYVDPSTGNVLLEDPPGTTVTVQASDAQQQSDILQNLAYADLSNATYSTKSQPSIGYTNPLVPNNFSPYVNNTSSPSTSTYTTSTTTTTTSSLAWNVSVKVTAEEKIFGSGTKAEIGAQVTWGTTLSNSLTVTQALTQTVQPGETLFLFAETPVYRFYGNWQVKYGNTIYNLVNVWYDTPYTAPGYPNYLAAYTCKTGTTKCLKLSEGDLSGYPNPFPNTQQYPIAESKPDAIRSSLHALRSHQSAIL